MGLWPAVRYVYEIGSVPGALFMHVLIGFLVAPLCVPLVLAPIFFLLESDVPSRAVFLSIVSMAFAYGGTVVFGVPTYLLLRSRNIAALWVALAAGFAYGALTMQLFLVALGLSLGASIQESVARLPDLITHPEGWPVGFMLPGVLGGMVGFTFWLIARPDRA